MSRTAWLVLGAAVAAGVAVAAFLVVRGPSQPSAEEALQFRGRSIRVDTDIRPRLHAFGEPITAEVVAVFNRALVRPNSVRVNADFDPYVLVAPEHRSREDEGELTRVTYRFWLQCATRQCLPGEPKRTIEFEQAGLAYTLVDPDFLGLSGGARTVGTLSWPPVEVASRLGPTSTQDVSWRAETATLPPPAYRFDPTLATIVLLGGAGGLVALAALLLSPFAPRRTLALAEDLAEGELSPLERALLLLETSMNGAVADRRRALELLARELAAHGEHELSARARALAWSKRPPSTEEATGFAGTVRSEVVE